MQPARDRMGRPLGTGRSRCQGWAHILGVGLVTCGDGGKSRNTRVPRTPPSPRLACSLVSPPQRLVQAMSAQSAWIVFSFLAKTSVVRLKTLSRQPPMNDGIDKVGGSACLRVYTLFDCLSYLVLACNPSPARRFRRVGSVCLDSTTSVQRHAVPCQIQLNKKKGCRAQNP